MITIALLFYFIILFIFSVGTLYGGLAAIQTVFYLFRSHGFQCNLQEYCPDQQKNISDGLHRIIYCRFDIVNVSMIK